jgi:hypothetical protein
MFITAAIYWLVLSIVVVRCMAINKPDHEDDGQ